MENETKIKIIFVIVVFIAVGYFAVSGYRYFSYISRSSINPPDLLLFDIWWKK